MQAEQPSSRALAEHNADEYHGQALSQIEQLCVEAHLDREKLAELIKLEVRSVYRHLAGEAKPRKKNLRAYQDVFSELLERPIASDNTSFKRKRQQ